MFLALNNEKRFACRTICISKPRQNGKSYSARYYAIWKAVIEGKKVLYSAHHGKTTREMFKAVKDFVDRNPSIKKKLLPGSDGIRKSAGLEGLFFANKGCIEFQTRTTSGGRGVTYDVIIIDEAQELTDEQLDAIKPTTIASESGDPQMIYLGTPPNAKCTGTVFRDFHGKVHSGDSEGIWWLEWAVDELPDMSDRMKVLDLAYMTNPAMGYRIREDVMLDVIDTATAIEGFAREYLGWWSPLLTLVKFAIAANRFESLALDAAPTQGRVAYGVKFSVDGSEVSLCAARLHDGCVYIEQIRRETMALGLGWLAAWIADRKNVGCCCVIDGKSGTQALVDKLGTMPKGYIEVPTAAQVVSACTTLVDRVNDGTLEWFRPQTDLRDSAITSTRRKIGQTGGWGFDGENPIPIEAASLALWGVLNTKRNPERKQRIG